jgi:P4 family phage/plasmid primase-like protien
MDGINHELRSRIGKDELTTSSKLTPPATLELDPESLPEFEYANRLADSLPPIKTCGHTWHSYSSGAWSEIDRAILRPQAQNILPEKIRTARREATLLDHLEGRFQVPQDSFAGFYKLTPDGNILINAHNGVVCVAPSGAVVLEPHSDRHMFTHRLAAKFDDGADCPLFQRILNEALADDDDKRLYQFCAGNFLLPDCRYETALVCYGEAGRGKSTLAEPVGEVFGRTLVPRLTLSQLCDPKSYHLPKLKHAAVNLGTELDAIELGDSAIFKAVVSGEPVEARPIYGAPFTMATSCKLWFLSNCLPRFRHGTEAELRRTRFLRFDYLPPKKDVTLKGKLAQERDGVFRWMLEGLQYLLHQQNIPLGGRHSREVHERFRVSNDPVGSFVSSRCVLDPGVSISKETLRTAYREFCEEYELPVSAGEWFFKALYERWTQIGQSRVRDGEKRCQAIRGICLKPI